MALNPNLTTTEGLSAEVQVWYDRKMLKDMKPKLVHYEYGQKRAMPKNGGKTVSFRKWTPFGAITQPLLEGVVPEGQSLSMTEVTATVAGYGGYVAVSDLLDATAIDPVAADAVELMADQGGLSIDTLIRDTVNAGTNVQYGGNKTHRYALTAQDKLTTTDLRKAVRTLKKNNAPTFTRGGKGYYVAIVGPDSTYDLQSDATWQDVAKYQDKERIFSGEIGRIFGVIVVETPQSKLFAPAPLSAASAGLTVASWSDETKTATLQEALTEEEAQALVGRSVLVADVSASGTPEAFTMITAAAAGEAGSATITLKDNQTDLGFAVAGGDRVLPGEGGAGGSTVASTLVFGRDAYGVIDIEGDSNVQAIVKPAGSGGCADPLNQISTVGWKVTAFAARILQQGWMVRIEHGFSA